ncbi:MAG TPA: hypothetical protein VGN12_22175 [Pirellulales bacterium]|jgi:hypothetical protein
MSTRKQKAQPKPPAFDKANKSGSVQPEERPSWQSDTQNAGGAATEIDEDDRRRIPDRTGGQNGAVDQKRNDEQQYHAAGVAHDPHHRTQERIDRGDPDAGDVDDETRAQSAPFNKTYGHHP